MIRRLRRLESPHNCIVHQDFTHNSRVAVIEQPDRLIFENKNNRISRRDRNYFMTQTLSALNLIDAMGFGIHDMYIRQANRYLPMPYYDLSEPWSVKPTIYGSVADPAHSRMPIRKPDLPLADVLSLTFASISLLAVVIFRKRAEEFYSYQAPAIYRAFLIDKITWKKRDKDGVAK